MKLKQNALSNFASMGARQIAFYIESKDDCCIMFSVCNLLTKAERFACGKPDSPQFSYVELTLY
ncbi:hypothetical protein B1J93_04200 [Leptospira kirschneri serovar Pomona]|uniref:Uncharacterized protein n=1 Tax=Leptospira kirschneri serovar Pomona TaxID=561005 RepID=A0A1T1DZ98_9LEPT|nr:hypothetical protein B1J93_04200 [Leptospira kirschneri serovar Pomona]